MKYNMPRVAFFAKGKERMKEEEKEKGNQFGGKSSK